MTISFSSDSGLKKGYFAATRILAERYFKTSEDPNQIHVNKVNSDWIFTHIPDCFNVIFDGREVIGFSLVIPSTRGIALQFINKRITESGMFEKIKKLNLYDDMDALYLCSSFLKPEYRGKGIIYQARQKILKKVTALMGTNAPLLYFWGYSEQGRASCLRFAQTNKLEILERKD